MVNKKEEKPKVLQNYTVKVEALVPTLYVYTVQAYSPEEAADVNKFIRTPPKSKQHFQTQQKIRKITVYKLGMSIIEFVKKLF